MAKVRLVAFAGSRCPRASAIQRHLGTSGQPQPPGPIGRLADTDARAADAVLLLVEHHPDWTPCVEQVNPVVLHGDSHGRTQISRPASQSRRTDRLAAATLGDIESGLDRGRPQQHGARDSLGRAHDVRADVYAVAPIGVEPPGRHRTSPSCAPLVRDRSATRRRATGRRRGRRTPRPRRSSRSLRARPEPHPVVVAPRSGGRRTTGAHSPQRFCRRPLTRPPAPRIIHLMMSSSSDELLRHGTDLAIEVQESAGRPR